jgi:alpha-tubulin suppressor-like RCC1 family protein
MQVTVLTDVTDVDTGYINTVALKSDGSVWTWGFNIALKNYNLMLCFFGGYYDYRHLGYGSNDYQSNIPEQVTDLTDVTAIAANHFHIVAQKSDGSVWAWGYNEYGQLGNGTHGISNNSKVPVRVPGIANMTAVTAGSSHTVAFK